MKKNLFKSLAFASVCTVACMVVVAFSCRNDAPTTQMLKTGWYRIVDSATGIERTLASDAIYYLDPNPVITAQNFASMVVNNPIPGSDRYEIVVQLDEAGREAFKTATANSIKRDLAFIVDNELFSVVRVHATIPNGILTIGKRNFTKSEAEKLKAKIEAERERSH